MERNTEGVIKKGEKMIVSSQRLKNGDRFIILGITDENIEKLRKDMPIVMSEETHKIPKDVKISIIWGHTEQDIVDKLRMIWPGIPVEETDYYKRMKK